MCVLLEFWLRNKAFLPQIECTSLLLSSDKIKSACLYKVTKTLIAITFFTANLVISLSFTTFVTRKDDSIKEKWKLYSRNIGH